MITVSCRLAKSSNTAETVPDHAGNIPVMEAENVS